MTKTKYSKGFLDFWAAYPTQPSGRRQAKLKCWKAWRKYQLEDMAFEVIELLERYKESDKWQDGYEKMTLTWLNSTPWEAGTSIPPCTSKDEAEHQSRLQQERKDARDNSLAQSIAQAAENKDEREQATEWWRGLSVEKKKELMAYWARKTGMKPPEKMVSRWAYKEQADGNE